MSVSSTTTTTVRAITVFYKAGTSDKFYRVYVVNGGQGCLLFSQYGRRGATGSFTPRRSYMRDATATNEADDIIAEKMKKGYGNRRTVGYMSTAVDTMSSCLQIAQDFAARYGDGDWEVPQEPATVEPEPVAPEGDRLSAFSSQALQAISLAVTDPAAATALYASLNDQAAALQAEFDKTRSYLSTLDKLLGVSA